MAKLNIYREIQSDTEKNFMRLVGGTEGISYTDIDQFIGAMDADDNEIDIRLHCDGGLVTEGWAIYDRLRSTGKEISAVVEGNCASMATIILMAAPKERRCAYENSHILIHNPWIDPARIGQATANDLITLGNDLMAEQERMVDLYVERCGCDRDTIRNIMDANHYITAEDALQVGLIGRIIPPMSALSKPDIIDMEKQKSTIDKVLAMFGLKSLDEQPEMKGMDVNTADGVVITIEREEGEPQVGDKASPDGRHTMPDESIIVVENGIITEIIAPTTEGEEEADEQKGDTATDDDVVVETEEEKPDNTEVEELRERVAELEKKIDELTAMLVVADSKAKTEDDEKILDLVEKAGGESVLAKISSTFVPEGRQLNGQKASQICSAADIMEKYNLYKK